MQQPHANSALRKPKQAAALNTQLPQVPRSGASKVDATRQERALARFQEQQAKWEAFSEKAAARTDRPKEQLVVARSEEYRERLEVMELLDRATPEEVKSGGHSWYHSLRGEGTRYVQIGNMFSGLYLPVKMNKDHYVSEIVRKPLLRDLVASRVDDDGRRIGPRTWRDDEYLLQRMRKYRKKMEELAPGLLGHDEILEPEVVPLRPPVEVSSQKVGIVSADPQTMDDLAPVGDVQDEATMLRFKASPDRMEFQAGVYDLCTRMIKIRNSGKAVVAYEWVQDVPEHNYQESVLPDDPTDRFTCHCTKGTILPGRELTTCFTFTSATPGAFSTSWSLRTSPELTEPLVGVLMHGVATIGDLLQERRTNLQVSMREQQVLHQVQEVVEDMIESVRLQQPPAPDMGSLEVQERLFEDANAQLGLYFTPHAWQHLGDLTKRVESLKSRCQVKGAPAGASANAARRTSAPSAVPRGRLPQRPAVVEPIRNAMSKPLELGAPSAKLLTEQLDAVQTAVGSEAAKEKQELAVELAQAVRAAAKTPLERSPIWWLAYETIVQIASSIPGKVKSTRRMYSLDEHFPFIPPLPEQPTPEEEAAHQARLEKRQASRGEEQREAEWKSRLLEKVASDCFGHRLEKFSAVAEEAGAVARIRRAAAPSLRDRLQPYLDRQSADGVELGGSVLVYEVDLGCLHRLARGTADHNGAAMFALEGDERELLRQRFEGVAGLLESSPLAVLVVGHLGEPRPDTHQPAAGLNAEDSGAGVDPMLEGVKERMQSLPSFEPFLELLREVAEGPASSIEFVPHEVWLGDAAAFAERARSDMSENKVFLLENLAAFPEETGVHRAMKAAPAPEAQAAGGQPPPADHAAAASPAAGLSVGRLAWAKREAWAVRAFGKLLPDILVQDSFTAAISTYTLHTGLWAAAPQRYYGMSIENEFASFIDTLSLPFKAGASSEEVEANHVATTSMEDKSGSSPHVPAPLLAVLGGGGYTAHDGEEALYKKLELLLGISKLVKHEPDGLLIALGGELAVAVLAGVLGIRAGASGSVATKAAMRSALMETVLEVLRSQVGIRLPVDLVCEMAPRLPPEGAKEPPPPADVKKTGKSSPPPVAADTEPEQPPRTFALGHALWQAAQSPISLGFVDGVECFLDISPEEGLVRLAVGEPPEPPERPAAPPGAEGGEAPEGASHPDAEGIPDNWVARDIGELTVEGLRTALRRHRGVLWNGALGKMEDERWQAGTRAFLAAVETRLAGDGADDDEEAADGEQDDEERDDEDGAEEDGDPDRSKSKEEIEVEFEVAVVIGHHSRRILPSMMSPSLISFLSQSGEGLLQVLRGAPLPGLLACAEKGRGH